MPGSELPSSGKREQLSMSAKKAKEIYLSKSRYIPGMFFGVIKSTPKAIYALKCGGGRLRIYIIV